MQRRQVIAATVRVVMPSVPHIADGMVVWVVPIQVNLGFSHDSAFFHPLCQSRDFTHWITR
jgi:hypothetical protein